MDVEALATPAFLARFSRRPALLEIRLNAAGRVRAELAGLETSPACPTRGSGGDGGTFEAALLACAATRLGGDVALPWPGHGGAPRWRASLAPVLDEDGGVTTVLGLCREVARHGQDKSWAGDHLSLALQAIHGAEWRYDLAAGTYRGSDEIATLIGEEAPRCVAWAEWLERVHPQDLALFMPRPASEGTFEFRFQANGGTPRWGRCSRVAVTDPHGQVEAVLGIMVDITEERARASALADLATHDPLTGLLNRLGLRQEIDRLQSDLPPGQSLAIFAVDLDHFKTTNDEHGHAAGDAVLVEASRRLATALGDTVCARLGGDEFVAILPVPDRDQGQRLRERLWQEFRRPLAFRGRWLPVSASVGVAYGAARIDFTRMMDAADADLYADKRAKAASSVAA
jgi:diguanylate cyclase (GGDEF)-like protein